MQAADIFPLLAVMISGFTGVHSLNQKASSEGPLCDICMHYAERYIGEPDVVLEWFRDTCDLIKDEGAHAECSDGVENLEKKFREMLKEATPNSACGVTRLCGAKAFGWTDLVNFVIDLMKLDPKLKRLAKPTEATNKKSDSKAEKKKKASNAKTVDQQESPMKEGFQRKDS